MKLFLLLICTMFACDSVESPAKKPQPVSPSINITPIKKIVPVKLSMEWESYYFNGEEIVIWISKKERSEQRQTKFEKGELFFNKRLMWVDFEKTKGWVSRNKNVSLKNLSIRLSYKDLTNRKLIAVLKKVDNLTIQIGGEPKSHRLGFLKKLPNLTGLDLMGSLHDEPEVTDRQLAHLSALTQLQYLDLSHTKISDKGIEKLSVLTQLKHLDLSWTEVADEGIAHLSALLELQELDLAFTKIADEGLAIISTFKQLKILGLTETLITDSGMAHLAGLTQLRSLYLSKTKITDDGLAHLSDLTQLRHLVFWHTESITDKGMVHLSTLTKLQYISLSCTKVTDAGLIHLSNLSELVRLDLTRTGLTDVGILHFAHLRKLRILELSETQITDAGLAHLSNLTQLQHLTLSDTKITEASVPLLSSFKHLNFLEIPNKNFNAGYEAVEKAHPEAKIIQIFPRRPHRRRNSSRN